MITGPGEDLCSFKGLFLLRNETDTKLTCPADNPMLSDKMTQRPKKVYRRLSRTRWMVMHIPEKNLTRA
jgi:hypothetical protein